eukprot:5829449-Lingulodinium_polyedra.AAC.1
MARRLRWRMSFARAPMVRVAARVAMPTARVTARIVLALPTPIARISPLPCLRVMFFQLCREKGGPL